MKIERIVLEFSQDASCANKEAGVEGIEFLKVEYTSDLGIGNDKEGYFIFTTDREGFSFNDKEEVTDLMDKVKECADMFIKN